MSIVDGFPSMIVVPEILPTLKVRGLTATTNLETLGSYGIFISGTYAESGAPASALADAEFSFGEQATSNEQVAKKAIFLII
jgi:hypothetical protein